MHDHPRPFCGEGCPAYGDLFAKYPTNSDRAFANPCLYCGLDDDETPYEDTEEHRASSQHQWAVYNS